MSRRREEDHLLSDLVMKEGRNEVGDRKKEKRKRGGGTIGGIKIGMIKERIGRTTGEMTEEIREETTDPDSLEKKQETTPATTLAVDTTEGEPEET